MIDCVICDKFTWFYIHISNINKYQNFMKEINKLPIDLKNNHLKNHGIL
jgi:hypothetical protein